MNPEGLSEAKCTAILVKKNYCWIWITFGEGFAVAVDRIRKKFLNFVVGDRSNRTAKKFWAKIKNNKMKKITSDYCKVYPKIVPKEKHIQSKAERL